MAEAVGEGRSCSIDFTDSGQPSLIWLTVDFQFEGVESGNATESLARAASTFNHDLERGKRLFRGIVYDQTRPGRLSCMLSVDALKSPVYNHPDLTRNAIQSVQGVADWHGVAASEGARIDPEAMDKALRKEIDSRLSMYRSALSRADIACLTIADLFGMEHPLSEDVLASQDAFEVFLAARESYAPDLHLEIPETISLSLKRASLL